MTIPEALEHTRDRTNRCQWTYELLAAMFSAQSAHPSHADGSRISTTVLTNKCLRQLVFERQQDFVRPLDNLWAMFRGTQFHAQLEAFAHPESYGEARFYVDDLGVQLPAVKAALPAIDRSFSGSPDLVDPGVGILYDYKRTKEVPRYDMVWGDHIAQLNINRWLVDNADRVALKDPTALGVASIGAGGLLSYDDETETATWDMRHPDVRARFVPVDWQELVIVYVDDKGPKPITVRESVSVPAKKGGYKRAKVPVIWDDDTVTAFIAEKYVKARRALRAGIAPIPKGWEHQSHTLCGYCPMRHMCAETELVELLDGLGVYDTVRDEPRFVEYLKQGR